MAKPDTRNQFENAVTESIEAKAEGGRESRSSLCRVAIVLVLVLLVVLLVVVSCLHSRRIDPLTLCLRSVSSLRKSR